MHEGDASSRVFEIIMITSAHLKLTVCQSLFSVLLHRLKTETLGGGYHYLCFRREAGSPYVTPGEPHLLLFMPLCSSPHTESGKNCVTKRILQK